MALFDERMEKALALAARGHQGQLRKGTTVPYVAHPVHVAMLLMRAGADDTVVLAGVLHDTLEDTSVTRADIVQACGEDVAALVEAVTQQDAGEGGAGWKAKKQAALDHLSHAGPRVALLKAADTFHNTRALRLDVERDGPAVMERFKRPPQETLWYYGEVSRRVGLILGEDHVLVAELAQTIQWLRTTLGLSTGG